MHDNEFFVVDMANCTSTGEVINSLSLALETLSHTGKKIVLKLNDSYLNQSQMLSIQSLITSYGCILDTVETINPETAKIVENMNIFVQEPIEKRIEEKYEKTENDGFETFSMEKHDEGIAVKDVNGLHFEADLDAIQKQQDDINISSDLENAGINPRSDFQSIGDQVSQKYSKPEDVLSSIEGFESFAEFANPTKEVELKEVDNMFSENNTAPENNVENNNDTDKAEKNSISVYKKAYDEFAVDKEEWEEVDFYETPTTDPIISDTKNTVYINQTLRSGQILESDGNVVIIGDCHPGSEIRAIGDITVWGVLSGIAHAGCKGNINAKVRALKMNAVQLRIGNCYSRRPDSTNIPYIIRSSVFTPEEARAVNNEIMLFKINQN